MLTDLEGLLPILLYPSVTWSFEITWQTKTIISTTTVFMAIKFGRIVTNIQWFLPILLYFLVTWPKARVTNKNISPLPRCLWPPKLGRGVTYREGKSDDRRVTWSRKTKWQTKIMYHLPQCLWLLNLAGWGYKTRSSLS